MSIPFYCSSLANPVPLKRDLEADGECARPVEFPQGNPIQQGELGAFSTTRIPIPCILTMASDEIF